MLFKHQYYGLLSACVAFSWFALHVGGAALMNQVDKIERFKKRVDFDRAIAKENPDEAVYTVWPNMLKSPGLAEAQWKVVAESVWSASGGIAKEWTLRRNREQIVIVIFVSSLGNAPAQNFFVARATENMMRESPFEKSSLELGTLAVNMPAGVPANVIWIFRNVCFDVRIDNSQTRIESVAQWLQAVALASVVDTNLVPPFAAKVNVSKRQSSIKDPIEVHAELPAGSDSSRYMLDLKFDKDRIEVVSLERLSANIAGATAGRTGIEALLIDTATLQSRSNYFELEILPKP